MNQYPVVYVEWEDSAHILGGWNDLQATLDQHDAPMICETVGLLIRREKGLMIIAQSVSPGHDGLASHIGHGLTIPERAIKTITILLDKHKLNDFKEQK